MRRRMWLAVAVVLGLVLVAGCGGGGSGGDDSGVARDASSGGSGGGASAGDEATGGGAGEEAGGGDLGAQAPPADDPARIIYTSDLRVRVEDPAAAARDAIGLVEEAGGSLASQSELEGEGQVTVSVRVPVDGFRPALEALAGLGTVLDRQVDAQDVTDQVVDLEGRLENARASADRLRALYATAADVQQVVAIEQALTEREAEVESLAGQLQQIEDRADRSTITVTFVERGEPVATEDDDANAFVRGLRAAVDVILGLATVAAAIAGFLVPFSPLLLVAALVGLIVRQRSRRRRRAAAGSTPTPPSGPGPVVAATAPPEPPSAPGPVGGGVAGEGGQAEEPPTPRS